MKAYLPHYRQELFENQVATFIILPLAVLSFSGIFLGFSLPVFLFACSIGLILSLWVPRSGILSIIFLTTIFTFFFSLQSFQWGSESYKLYSVDILLGSIFVTIGIRLLIKQEIFSYSWQAIDRWFLAFLVWMTVIFGMTLAYPSPGVNFDTALSTWKNYVFYGLLYFCIPILFHTREQLARIAKIFLAGCVVSIIFLLIGIINGQGLWVEYTPLSTEGTRYLDFSHAFYFSMAALIVIFSWQEYSKTTWWKYGRAFLLFLWIVGIIVSLMRHLWIGLTLVLVAMFLIVGRESKIFLLSLLRKSVFGGIVFGVIALYGIVLFQNYQLQSEIKQLAQSFTQRAISLGSSADESIVWRNAAWQGATKVFSENIFLGTGFGVKIPVEMKGYQDFVEIRNIHNSWLALLIQTGFIGFGIFVTFVASLGIKVLNQVRKLHQVGLGMGYVVLSIFLLHLVSFPFQPYLEANFTSVFFWINLGVMRSYLNMYTEKEKQS